MCVFSSKSVKFCIIYTSSRKSHYVTFRLSDVSKDSEMIIYPPFGGLRTVNNKISSAAALGNIDKDIAQEIE